MKTSRAKIVFLILISLSLVMLAASAQAAPPVGQWNLTFYYDDAGFAQGATQGICFEGGPSKGTWYSTTFAGWSGDWWRKGGISDTIMLKGNYNSGEGNDGAKVELLNTSLMTGSWVEWRDSGLSLYWFQVRLNKQDTICDPPALLSKPQAIDPAAL
jgi:hypothetical protein